MRGRVRSERRDRESEMKERKKKEAEVAERHHGKEEVRYFIQGAQKPKEVNGNKDG